MRTSPWPVGLLAGLLLGCAHQPAPAPEPPIVRVAARERATTPEENLVAFARAYGYVRFFHPTDASQDADWQHLAVVGVQQVHDAPTVDALAERLDALLRPLCPSLQLWADGEAVPPPPPPPLRRDGLVFWQYLGFPSGWVTVSLHRPLYAKARVHPDERWRRRFSESPAPNTRVESELAPGLHLRLPVVLSAAQAEQAAPSPPPALSPPLDLARDHGALAVRQAAVIEVWNVLRHFYPYQQDLELDWDAMLRTSLRDAEDDQSIADVRDTLRGLLEPLRDGHGHVGHARHGLEATLPMRLELIEGRAVVTGTRDPERFAIGDVVTTIAGRPAHERIEQIAARLSGSAQWRAFLAACELTQAELGEVVELVLERDGKPQRVQAEGERMGFPLPPRPPALHTFEDGVRYVDLTRVDQATLRAEIPLLALAPGIVFDVRGYPDNDLILDHLLEQPEDTLWMHVPRFVEPDGRVVGWHDIGWHRRPSEPHIGAPVTFLISAEAISYAESMLSYVEAHHLGTLVGTPTAGANGDIVRFDTLAGFYVIYSGMRVTRHDGTPFHQQGVRPDVEVHPTLAGLRAGRDEVLEAGLRVVRQAPPSQPAIATTAAP